MTDLRMRLLGALVLIAALAGCGVISSDVTDFNLALEPKKFSIDTASWDVDPQLAMGVLGTMCTASTQCNAAAEMACAMDCSGTCNTMSRCEIKMAVALHTKVDLVAEKPELQQIQDKPVIDVTLDSVEYAVLTNTLNVATPELTVYVAPMSVMEPGSPEAKAIGTIPAVPAGMTQPKTRIVFNAGGEAVLVQRMGTYKTPFNVIVGSHLLVTAGQMIPQGKLEAEVYIRAHAGI
jgi:hypothetical protein